MPKRSNDFQKLVLILHKHQFQNTIEIVESKELIDKVTGEKREVDIYMTIKAGTYILNISIECVERNRKMDVGWVEMMKSKHDKLETNQLILISKSGFTKQAIKYAENRFIKCFTYNDLNEEENNPIFSYKSLVFKLFSQSITKVNFIVESQEGKIINVSVDSETTVFDAKGIVLGTAGQLVAEILRAKSVFEQFWKDGLEEHKYYTIRWENIALPFFLQELVNMTLQRIQEIIVIGGVDFTVKNFETHSGQINDSKFIWGKVNIDDKNNLIVVGTPNETGAKFTITNK
jgi:hypothetical protein